MTLFFYGDTLFKSHLVRVNTSLSEFHCPCLGAEGVVFLWAYSIS